MNWMLVWDSIVPFLVEISLGGVFAVLAAIKLQIPDLIAAKKNEYKENAAAKAGYTALAYLTDVVAAVVAKVEQTTMRDLRAAKADGKITGEEFGKLARNALDAAVDEVKAATLGKLMGSFGMSEMSAHKLIVSKIEAEVPKAKAVNPPRPRVSQSAA